MKATLSRETMIDRLVDNWDAEGTNRIENIMRHGFIGYENMGNKDLRNEYEMLGLADIYEDKQ